MKKPSLLTSNQFIRLIIVIIFSFFINGCKEDFNGYYDPPEGLTGPIYEQIASEPEFSEFAKAIDKLPLLKRAINTSGLYTVFVPTNEAMQVYLQSQGKTSVDDYDMSIEDDSLAIDKLVNGHILFNMYFKYNFDELIDEKEEIISSFNIFTNDVYRFGSRYREPDYWYDDESVKLNRRVRPGYKVLSVYTKEYIDKYNMEQDYEDIFGSVPGEFNIEDAQVLTDKMDISAKNGAIHGINKVLEVKPSIDEILKVQNPYYSGLLEKFVFLLMSGIEGIDTIFYKTYMQISNFNFSSDNNVGTLLCPAMGTFDEYVNNNVLPSFDNSFDSVPYITAAYLLAQYLIDGRRWLSDLQSGVINWIGDTIVNPSVSEKIIASNGIVYVTPDLLLSSAFTTVVKVPMLDKKFSWFLQMLAESSSNFIELLRYKKGKYTLFVPTNEALENYGVELQLDSRGDETFYYKGLKMQSKQIDTLINYLIINNQEIDPTGITNKWIPTRSGNFMNFKNGRINGAIPCIDQEDTDNGYAYTLEVMPEPPKQTLSSYIGATDEESYFYTILKRWYWDQLADETLAASTTFDVIFKRIDGSNSFTVFIPTNDALEDYKSANNLGDYEVDSLWQDIAQYHIVKTRAYTEGSFQRKPDNPLPEDSTKFVTLYKDIVYPPENIFAKDHYAYIEFIGGQLKITGQDGDVANIISAYDMETKNGAIHHINKVLKPPVRQKPDEK